MKKELRNRVSRVLRQFDIDSARLSSVKEELLKVEKEKKASLHNLKIAKRAMSIIQREGARTQRQTVYKIENLVTYAIRDVFEDDGYNFKIKLDYNKRSMSVTFLFERDGELYDPLECCGYGVVDVACFALRIAVWSLKPSARTMILDEPFKNVSDEYKHRVGALVRKISQKSSFQFIIFTHIKELTEYGDKCFRLTKAPNRTTLIEVIERNVA